MLRRQLPETSGKPARVVEAIDFEGLNAISLFRQAQIRYTQPFRESLSFSAAVENPAPDLTGAAGVNLTPDFVARVRWDPAKPAPGLTTRMRSGEHSLANQRRPCPLAASA